MKCENNTHYFLVCPKYAIERNVMRQTIQTIFQKYNIPIDYPINDLLLLFGVEAFGDEANFEITISVQNYIRHTKRFP